MRGEAGMDMEKLIEALHTAGAGNGDSLYHEAAAAICGLQAEIAMRRKMQPVQLDGNAARAFVLALELSEARENLKCVKAENKKLRNELEQKEKTVELYAAAARTGALWLGKFCNRNLSYPQMLADASRKAAREIERLARVKRERDAAVCDLESVMFVGKENSDTCKLCAVKDCYARGGHRLCDPKWRGLKEE